MIIIRFILICLIVYLLVKGFVRSLYPDDPPDNRQDKSRNDPKKKISRNVGEYIDYEEVE